MTQNELMELLNAHEWRDVEFKEAQRAVPRNAYETVSAFANTEGGHMLGSLPKPWLQKCSSELSKPTESTPWLSIWRIGFAKLTEILTNLMHGVRTCPLHKFSLCSPTCPLHKFLL